MAVEAQATARGVRTSAQKAGLVCSLIRGKSVNQAVATLQFTPKTIARELAKVLRSAVANIQQSEGFGGDIERLYVSACYANQGQSMRSEEHTSELQSLAYLVCRLLLEKKNKCTDNM